MKVDFAGTNLCTGVGKDSPQNLDYDGEADEQVSKFLRGVQAVVRDRGNEYTTISFDITRSHGTIQAAEAFLLNHRTNSVKYGTLILTCDDGSHTNTTVMYLANAFWKRGRIKPLGMLTTTSYTFTGGLLSSTNPANT